VTEWIKADDPAAAEQAAKVIRAGGLVILPTDTVYGVGADWQRTEAVAALYAAKKRSPDKAIPILLADANHLSVVSHNVPQTARRLAHAFWPGPLTILVPKRPEVPEIVSAYSTLGVRIPNSDVARAVIRACGGALAVTSANISGSPNNSTAQAAAAALGESVALVLDGGECPGGEPSTVVDVSSGELAILREGPITKAALLATLR
jgi:L-threonylcarbamoyladenylate synthase